MPTGDQLEREHEAIVRLREAGWSCAAEAVIAAWQRGRSIGVGMVAANAPVITLPIPIGGRGYSRASFDGDVEFTESRCDYRHERGVFFGRKVVRILGRVHPCLDWVEVDRFEID